MAKTNKPEDRFANLAFIEAVESAANTLTFKKLETGISLFEKVAWIINRIDYFIPSATMALLVASLDGVKMAIATSNNPSTIDEDEIAFVDILHIFRQDIGTAGSGFHNYQPFTRDLSTLPGGGIIVPPNPLYLGVMGVSLASAATVACRLYYTAMSLTSDDFWELVESRRMISSS